MLPSRPIEVLRRIDTRLNGTLVDWAVTGSLDMALQGVPIEVHDFDIQTDKGGAYQIERRFAEHVVKPVRFSASEGMRSYFGKLEIDGIEVETMGDLQKRSDDRDWEDPVDVRRHRRWVQDGDISVLVLSLEYQYRAYARLGRTEKADLLRSWLQGKNSDGQNQARSSGW